MSQGAKDGGATMTWMDGMSQGAKDGGATMTWMGGMSQGARDGDVTHAHGWTVCRKEPGKDNCSSAIAPALP